MTQEREQLLKEAGWELYNHPLQGRVYDFDPNNEWYYSKTFDNGNKHFRQRLISEHFKSLDWLFRYILPPIREKYMILWVEFRWEDGLKCCIGSRWDKDKYGWNVTKADGGTEAEAMCNALNKLVEENHV